MKNIFISYSHRDEEWKERLVKHLRVLELEGFYQVWDDRKIKPGSDWLPEIEKALDTAGTAILLISADFLISDFIRKKEIPRLLERREKEGLKVIPLIVHPCAWQKVPWLGKIQAFPEDGVPLSKGTGVEIDENLAALAEMVVDIVKDNIEDESPLPTDKHLKKTILLTGLPQRKIELIGRKEDLQMLEERIKETDRVLLVIDNIKDPKDEHLDTLTTLPVNFKVIANSRLHMEGFEVHTLDFLTPDYCKVLFYHYYQGERHDEFVEKIVERCGLHTLTVELLARTAHNAAMPVKSFYEILEGKGFNLNDVIGDKVHTFWHNEKERKRFFNHLLKIFALSGVTDAELNILVNLSVLPAIYISISVLSEWLKLGDKETINGLVRKGWLRRDKFNIFMHQVIQEVIRYKTAPDAEKCKNLIKARKWKLYLESGDNPINKKEFVIFADSLVRHIDENDEELAALANNLGEIFRHMGQLEQALKFQKKALEIRENVLDKMHPDLAQSYHNLSKIYFAREDSGSAKRYAKQAVSILQHLFPHGHPNLNNAKENLEKIKRQMGQWGEL